MSPPLSNDQLERYARHIVLRDVGGKGQHQLLQSKVLVIGAGGLGSPLILYLAAAGVGTIGVVDDDHVSLSNLQRQILHDHNTIGTPKTSSAATRIANLNPDVNLITHTIRLNAHNAHDLISTYDLVADGSDNFPTRYLVNDACYFAKRPLVSAAVGSFEGQLTTFRAYETYTDGTPKPNYRCLYPDASTLSATCSETGILGAVTGVMGSLQALEIIKEILNIGESLVGRLLLYEALTATTRLVRYRHDPANPLTGLHRSIHDLSVHQN